MRGEVLNPGIDVDRFKFGDGPVENDTERREEEGELAGRYDEKG